MSHGKPFSLYTHPSGPNGWKVVFVLEELGLAYESIYLDFSKAEQKSPEFTKYNPNGRIPALVDHQNNDFVVWESAAILVYLAEKYDTDHKISVADPGEKVLVLQWLFFQASGQGPYYGQASWFKRYHPEKIPSAVVRYQRETIRVLSVLESVLSKQEWLVGNKYTIADLSFVPWNVVAVNSILKDFEDFDDFKLEKEFPAVYAWHQKIVAREAIAKTFALKKSLTG